MNNQNRKSIKVIDGQVYICQPVKVNPECHPEFDVEIVNAALCKNTSAIKAAIEQRMKQCITRLELASGTIYSIQETKEGGQRIFFEDGHFNTDSYRAMEELLKVEKFDLDKIKSLSLIQVDQLQKSLMEGVIADKSDAHLISGVVSEAVSYQWYQLYHKSEV